MIVTGESQRHAEGMRSRVRYVGGTWDRTASPGAHASGVPLLSESLYTKSYFLRKFQSDMQCREVGMLWHWHTCL